MREDGIWGKMRCGGNREGKEYSWTLSIELKVEELLVMHQDMGDRKASWVKAFSDCALGE